MVIMASCGPAPGTKVSEIDGMVLVYVPEGEFEMGSEDGMRHESPVHRVFLDAFWIDQTEVTNEMFSIFVDGTGYETLAEDLGWSKLFKGDRKYIRVTGADLAHPQGPDSNIQGLEDHPVVHVSWDDASAYCEWAGRRLPTEAEREKAARGTDGAAYPWGNGDVSGNLLNFADSNLGLNEADNSVDDGYQLTAPVGNYPQGASPYGALDMAGNVWGGWATGMRWIITAVHRDRIQRDRHQGKPACAGADLFRTPLGRPAPPSGSGTFE